jgi:hypothetical protein
VPDWLAPTVRAGGCALAQPLAVSPVLSSPLALLYIHDWYPG